MQTFMRKRVPCMVTNMARGATGGQETRLILNINMENELFWFYATNRHQSSSELGFQAFGFVQGCRSACRFETVVFDPLNSEDGLQSAESFATAQLAVAKLFYAVMYCRGIESHCEGFPKYCTESRCSKLEN